MAHGTDVLDFRRSACRHTPFSRRRKCCLLFYKKNLTERSGRLLPTLMAQTGTAVWQSQLRNPSAHRTSEIDHAARGQFTKKILACSSHRVGCNLRGRWVPSATYPLVRTLDRMPDIFRPAPQERYIKTLSHVVFNHKLILGRRMLVRSRRGQGTGSDYPSNRKRSCACHDFRLLELCRTLAMNTD